MPTLITEPPAGLPPLPQNFQDSKPRLCYQGAEALIYRTTFPLVLNTSPSGVPIRAAFLKHRPSKPYRHPIIDAKLTRHRILAEARVLAKLRREGINVPAIYALDWEAGWMLGEWIEGQPVRSVLDWAVPQWLDSAQEQDEVDTVVAATSNNSNFEQGLFSLMARIGSLVGKMHAVGVVHGDLTTSNLLLSSEGRDPTQSNVVDTLRSSEDPLCGEVYLVDFGLVDRSIQDEDRAVDLYVLERAFGNTHPRTEGLFYKLLETYAKSYKGAHVAVKRLEEVRLRGRKKIMIG